MKWTDTKKLNIVKKWRKENVYELGVCVCIHPLCYGAPHQELVLPITFRSHMVS